MQLPHFDLIRCSWPRPVEQAEGRWVSEPAWDAPAMPCLPQRRGGIIDDESGVSTYIWRYLERPLRKVLARPSPQEDMAR